MSDLLVDGEELMEELKENQKRIQNLAVRATQQRRDILELKEELSEIKEKVTEEPISPEHL